MELTKEQIALERAVEMEEIAEKVERDFGPGYVVDNLLKCSQFIRQMAKDL